jgi:hypothetical protein
VIVAGHWWLTPTILAQEKEKGAGGMAQSVGPEFKPQYCKKKKKNIYIYIYIYCISFQHSNDYVTLYGKGKAFFRYN